MGQIDHDKIAQRDNKVARLKRELNLSNPQNLAQHTGLSTGCSSLDAFLPCQGLPQGELTLFRGDLGLGSSSLWLETARPVLEKGRWAAWVGSGSMLFPLALDQRNLKLDHLLVVNLPHGFKKTFWVLQEILSLDLFDLVGCDQGLPLHQVRKLRRQAQMSHASVVLLQTNSSRSALSDAEFSLVLNFDCDGIMVSRARHRPTPFLISRRWSYAHLMSEFKENQQRRLGRCLSEIQPARAVSQT